MVLQEVLKKDKKKKPASISRIISVIFLVFIAIPAGSFALYLYTSYSTQLYQQALRDKRTAIGQLTNSLQTTMLSLEDLSRNLAYRSSIVGLLSRANLQEYPIWAAHQSEQSLLDLKYSLEYQNFGIGNISVYSANHSLKEEGDFYFDSRLDGQSFYSNLLQSGKNFGLYLLKGDEADLYYKRKGSGDRIESSDGVALFVQQILNPSFNSRVGLIIFEIRPDYLFRSLDKANEQKSGYFLLLTQNASYGTAQAKGLQELLDSPGKFSDGTAVLESRVYVYDQIQRFGVTVADSNPLDKNNYVMPALRVSLILIWMTAIQLIILHYFMKYIFGKINDSVNKMDSIVREGFSGRLTVTREDEIGRIAHRYNILLEHIGVLVEDLVKKENASKNAQIKALQYQINPHFIYNTLSIFSGNAEKNGNYELSEAISYFGHLMRYNIRDDGIYSTVGLEFENAVSLIKVYSLKSLGKLRLTILADEGLKQCKVIKFLLQPLLENSILHGRGSGGDDMIITVTAEREGDSLLISVLDDGVGMSAERLCSVRKHIYSGAPLNGAGSSKSSFIGLRNIYERVSLFYGEEGKMEIESREDCFTLVKVRIPYEIAEEK